METVVFSIPNIVGVAFEVLSGKYGNDAERVKKLKEMGYDVNRVQSCVNDIVALFKKLGG